jgi:hypothetical protein
MRFEWRVRASRIAFGSIFILVGAIVFTTRSQGQDTAQLRIGGGTLDVTFDVPPAPALRQLTLDWITRAANAVTIYYRRFPVKHVAITIELGEGSGVGAGRALGEGEPRIHVVLGSETMLEDLTEDGNDWIMTHEMVHLALSSVERDHHWLEEGLATYVEPISRVRAGELKADEVWRDMLEHMPQGQPTVGDQGLDGTTTWGRTYWGGDLLPSR